MAITAPSVSGEALVGQTLTCSEPVVTGGIGPYQFDYFWVDESNAIVWEDTYMSNTTKVVAYDIGKNMKCLVQVTDKGWSGGESITVSSNSVGPVRAPEIKAVTITVDGVLTQYGEPIHCKANDALAVEAAITGDASPSYKWEARGNYPMGVSDQAAITTLTFPQEGNATVTLTVTDPNATDSPISYAMNFYVASQSEWDALHP